MKKSAILLSLILCVVFFVVSAVTVSAGDTYDVYEVAKLLQDIDTLQQMQDKRKDFYVTKHYNANNASIVESHNNAREGYESYVADMFEKRQQAQAAYDSLSKLDKAKLDPALVEKLDNTLDTTLNSITSTITPGEDEYTFQIVSPNYTGYEVSSSYIKTGDVAATLILVDTTTSGDTWSPDKKYVYGECNYELTYCCDLKTLPQNGTHYKRTNLENGEYYSTEAAEKIRSIVEISYPFLTIEEMKTELIRGGLDKDLVASLTRSDLITGVQMAIWAYANVNDENFSFENVTHYGGSLRIAGHPYIPSIIHDYSNEMWHWWNQKASYRTFDEREEYRVNTLVEYLCSLEPKKPLKSQIVISEVEVVETQLIDKENDLYHITMFLQLDGGGNKNDNLELYATSYSENEDGTDNVTYETQCEAVAKDGVYAITTYAKDGDMIEVVVDGQQMLSKGAYFYYAGDRDASQSLVGISEGMTYVRAAKETLFVAEMARKPVTDIETPDSEITLKPGDEIQLVITVKPEDATNKEVTFESSDESVVTVDDKGNIKVVGTGSAVITVVSSDNPSVKKEIFITVPVIKPEEKPKHFICFGKTNGIGWFEVSVNGGEFRLQGPNSTLEVEEGSQVTVRVQNVWNDNSLTYYVNGQKYPQNEDGSITFTVDGYMLIGALAVEVDVPDVEESLNWLQKLVKAIRELFEKIAEFFR